MTNKLILFVSLLLVSLTAADLRAQRIQQSLSRSVVAVCDGSSGVTVTWRKLAQEPEGCSYNVYAGTAGGSYTLINKQPLTTTCYKTTLSAIPYGSEIAVTTLANGRESELSQPFTLQKQSWRDVFFDFNFETTVLDPQLYKCKYAWPMDIDGTGRMDAVLVDRLSTDGNSHKLQAYRLDGTCLWTIDVGPNIEICGGQNDNVTVYDINCDGRCEVIIKSSDGTRFWDAAAGTWGKYAGGSSEADTDGDGITDYRPSTTKTPPYYISVVDARTGEELDCSELKYSELTDGSDSYSRNGRANYKNDSDGKEYAFLTGKFVIAYFDGVHPALGVETYDRTTNGTHHYYMLSWQYDWTGGKPSNWHHEKTWAVSGAPFHQLRVADTNGDGTDAVMEGSFAWHPDQGAVFNAGIGHGDRFDVSDIDPERPGLEVFAIQQSSLLGQVLYDAATGEHIKDWYLSSVYDVGRGRCMDVDAEHKGWEMFSLLGGLYDCKGNVITEGDVTYPNEAIWWDGDLQRELIGSPGGSGYGTNVIVQKYNGTRLIQFSSESSWAVHSGWANRPAFVGDMTGDWREEIILMKQNATSSTGLVGYTTDLVTDYSMYTLQQDPHYRLDMTGRGYYQAPCPGFYLGGEMPMPPLPPVVTADLRWSKGSSWAAGTAMSAFDQTATVAYVDGKTVLFDISGDRTSDVSVNGTVKPAATYLMTPKGCDYTLTGSGTLAGDGDVWKSMQGSVTIGCNVSTTGRIVISEGTLRLDGTVSSPISLRARGTLSGRGTLLGTIDTEAALNYEGCRIKPVGTDGVLTFGRSLNLPGGVYIEVDAAAGESGRIQVNGDLTVSGVNTVTVNRTTLEAGTYTVAQCSGTLTVDIANLETRGLDGINYDWATDGGKLQLIVHDTRKPLSDVRWTGQESSVWDYKTENFQSDGQATAFVKDDGVVFDGTSTARTITVDDKMMPSDVVFDFDEGVYTLSGEGGISGTASLEKRGNGELRLTLPANDYTGRTVISGGMLTVSTLANGGTASCLGASSAAEGNLVLAGGTLRLTSTNMSTDHIVTVSDTSGVCVLKGGASMSFNGCVKGTGYLVKTGAGQLNFNYAGGNNFAGLILKAGVVSQGAWNATFGRSGSPMRLEGGELRLIDNNNSSTRPIFNYVATVPEGAKAQVTNTRRGAINGKFLGTGQLTILSEGVRGDIGADFSAFAGTLVAKGANCRLMDNVTDMSKTNLQLVSGSKVGHYASNGSGVRSVVTKVGSLSSTVTDCTLGNGSDTYSIGYNNASTTYAGLFSAASINKYGTGTLTLKTEGSAVPIHIYGGEIMLANSVSTPYTTGVITIHSGGSLSGTGCAANITVAKGGTLKSGSETACRTRTITGKLNLQQGSTLQVKVSGESRVCNDRYKVDGDIKHNGDTILISVDENAPLSEGDELTIITGAGTQSGNYILKTVSPGRTIVWDDTDFLTTGVLKVVSIPMSIDQVETLSDDDLVNVYRLNGQPARLRVRYAEALVGLPVGQYIVRPAGR